VQLKVAAAKAGKSAAIVTAHGYLCERHDSFMRDTTHVCVIGLICVPPSSLSKDIFVCDMTHSRVTRLDHV